MGMILVDHDVASDVPMAVDVPTCDRQLSSTDHGLSQSPPRKLLHSTCQRQDYQLPALLESCDAQPQGPGSCQAMIATVAQNEASEMEIEQERFVDFQASEGQALPDSCKDEQPGSPTSVLDLLDWDGVHGLEAIQLAALKAVATKGVCWSHPVSKAQTVFTLHYGGEVDADGNCLFTAAHRSLGAAAGDARSIREGVVRRFLKDYQSGLLPRDRTDQAIKHLYSPNLDSGWGVHVVQEVKLLAKKSERAAMNSAIEELMVCEMTREAAAESVYKERCTSVSDGASWASFMRVAGCDDDEHDIITLQYIQEGLLSVDENTEGRAAAFGDDIAIESLATEYAREVIVVQAHGADGMVDADSCLFFLPHRPRGATAVPHPPMFLFMKGTGWCGGGADHYEPVIARPRPRLDSDGGEKPAISL